MSYLFESFSGCKGHNIRGHNEHILDDDGGLLPRGGYAKDVNGAIARFRIFWQDGPFNREAGVNPNGAFVEDVLEVCKRRLEFYQDSPYACNENAMAIDHIVEAIEVLSERRADRVRRGVLGKDKV